MNWTRSISIGLFSLIIVGCSDDTALLAPRAETGQINQVHSKGKSDQRSAAPPFWTPLADGLIAHTDEYVIIPFLRELWGTSGQVCGADAPNLLVLDPAAFSCPLTVTGFEHWQDGKWDDGLPWDGLAPRQSQLKGAGAVPIVLADRNEFEAALSGGLSGAELLGLTSTIIGYADRFLSTNILGLSGPLGFGKGKYTITASGLLTDNRSFRILIAMSPGVERQVHLDIK